jgi:predicted transposase YdaD
MAEYAIRIYRKLGRYPKQIVLYVGEAPMRMSTSVREPEFTYQYKLVDIRDIDGDLLLASGHISDNLLAILTNLPDGAATVRLVLRRIANLHEEARRDAFARLLLLSGLRHLEPTVKEEAEKMPILNDIMDHQVLGPAIRQGREEGRQEGLQEGLQKGLQKGSHEGRQKMIRRLINKRFGTIPARVERRLRNMSTEELDEAAMRILEATSIEDVFSS